MKKLLSINLGLNNNPFTFTQLQEYFYNSNYYLLSAYTAYKKYKGEIEPTFVAVLEYNYTRDSKVIQDFENLCTVFNQECIAISSDSFDIMVFNPSYKGEKFKFSEDLFERPFKGLEYLQN